MAEKKPTIDAKSVKSPRKLKAGTYKSFRLQKHIKAPIARLPSAFQIFKASVSILVRNPKVFGGIVLVYSLLCIIFVQSLSGTNVTQLKNALHGSTGSQFGAILSGLMFYVYTSSSSSSTSNSGAGVYQLLLSIMASLAIIWTLRQIYAEKKVRIRDGFYLGMFPFVPFILVLLVVLLELIPLVVGAFLYGAAMTSVASTGVEQFLWLMIFVGLATITLYLLASSLLALYIVCLPGTTPMVALRSARKLAAGRRWTIIRKIIFLPIVLLVISTICIVPLVFIYAPLAPFVFLLASAIGLVIVHSYMYKLYRDTL